MRTEPHKTETGDSAAKGMPEIIRAGKDEMNLAEFPIALLSDRVPKGKKVIQYQDQIFDEKSGHRLTRKLTISAPEGEDGKSGLPTAADNDVILGLIQLTKTANNFTSREVEFSRLDLIRLLGWPDSGDSYARLATSLKRWLSVTLMYENAWRDNRQGAWITKGFHILDNIELNHTRTGSVQGELFPSKITWNKVVFESFEAGYLKSIDYGLYVKLRHSVSKQMYRFLSKRMYHGPDLDFDLRDFAFSHVGLSDSYAGNAGKIKEKLQPALEELEAADFLAPMPKDQRYRKDGKNWRIRLVAKSKSIAPPSPDIEAPPLVAELTKRGVSDKAAADLVAEYPAAFIQQKIDIFDGLVGTNDKRSAKSPAGYLVRSITDNYKIKGFKSPAERQASEAAKLAAAQADAENHRRLAAIDAQARHERELVAGFCDGMTKDQKAEFDAAAIAQANAEELKLIEPGPIKRFGMSSLRLSYARKLLVAQGKLPPQSE